MKTGIKVTRQQLCSCLEVICEYNPCFPNEGKLETAFKDCAQKNGEKTPSIEDIHVSFWIAWALIEVIIISEGNLQEIRLRQNITKMWLERKCLIVQMRKKEKGNPWEIPLTGKAVTMWLKKKFLITTDEEDEKGERVREPNRRCHWNTAKAEMPHSRDEYKKRKLRRDSPNRRCYWNVARKGMKTSYVKTAKWQHFSESSSEENENGIKRI